MIVYSPMASGLLSGAMTRERIAALPADDWRRHSEEVREPQLTRYLELVGRRGRGGAAPHPPRPPGPGGGGGGGGGPPPATTPRRGRSRWPGPSATRP